MYAKQLTDIFVFNLKEPIFFDTETLGLYGRTRLVQLRQGDISRVIDCFYVNIEEVKYYLKDSHLVGHNIHYDLSCQDFRRWRPRRIDDTMLLARFQWPELESHSLASLCSYLDLETKGEEGKSDWSQYHLSEAQLSYAEKDTLFVEQIYSKIDKAILSSNYYTLDIKSIELALEYQNKGMPLNHKQIMKYRREMQKGIKNSSLPKDLNISSPLQVKQYLGLDSSDKETLLKSNDLRAKEILNQRHYAKALSYFESIRDFNFLYGFISPGSAKTGRFTCKGGYTKKDEDYFNLQQIPRDFKSIFGVKGGAYFVCADYPALEIWTCGALIADEFLVSVLEKGEDLHYSAAEKMFNKPRSEVSKFERRVAKMCNFTLMYGAGAKTLANAFISDGIPEVAPRASDIRKDWLNTYKEVASNIQDNYKWFDTHSMKLTHTALGRPMMARTPMEALNFSIQGTGSECTKLALVLLNNYRGKKILPVTTVHDSIALVASDEAEAKEYAEALKWSMEEAYTRVIRDCKANHLRLKVEVTIGESYE